MFQFNVGKDLQQEIKRKKKGPYNSFLHIPSQLYVGKDLQQDIKRSKGPYNFFLHIPSKLNVEKDLQQEFRKRKGSYHYFLNRCQGGKCQDGKYPLIKVRWKKHF